jgi:hypothetical protein
MLPIDFDGIVMPEKKAPPKSSSKSAVASSQKKPADAKVGEAKQREASKSEAQAVTTVTNPKSVANLRSTSTPTAEKSSAAARLSTTRGTLPAEAALSFLRDTKGTLSWSLRDLSQTLNVSSEEAERVVALLQIQGYVQPEANKSGEWITTPSGETVSGAKSPRFDRETIEGALTSLRQRIEETNKDRAAKFEITRAVAFGDFLTKDRTRVQAADIGIKLIRKDRELPPDQIATPHSAVDAREEQQFLRQLRGRSALITLKPYSEWMGTRTHKKLL